MKWTSRLMFLALCLGIAWTGTVPASDLLVGSAVLDRILPYIVPDRRLMIEELLAPPPQPDGEFMITRGEADFYHPSIAVGGMLVWYTPGAEGLQVMGLLLGQDGHTPGEIRLIAGGPGSQSMPFVVSDTRPPPRYTT